MVSGTVTLLSSHKHDTDYDGHERNIRDRGYQSPALFLSLLSQTRGLWNEQFSRGIRTTKSWVVIIESQRARGASQLSSFLLKPGYILCPWPWSIEVLMVVSSVGLCLSLVMIKCRAGTRVTPTVSLGEKVKIVRSRYWDWALYFTTWYLKHNARFMIPEIVMIVNITC